MYTYRDTDMIVSHVTFVTDMEFLDLVLKIGEDYSNTGSFSTGSKTLRLKKLRKI